jgi:hypothetical protein
MKTVLDIIILLLLSLMVGLSVWNSEWFAFSGWVMATFFFTNLLGFVSTEIEDVFINEGGAE